MISNHPDSFWVEFLVSVVLLYQIVKFIAWYEVDGLCKEIFADVRNLAVPASKLFIQFQIEKTKNACKIVNVIHITIVKRIMSHH